MALVTLTNLLTYGNFEGQGWTGPVAYDTAHVRYGSYACRIDGNTGSPEMCIYHSGGAPMVQGHVYYGRWEVYHEGAQGSMGMYFPEAEPAFFEGHSLGSAGQWNLVSGRNVRSNWSSGTQTVRIDYNNGNAATSVWIDGAVLVDLTAAFGAGSEPDKAWCDANIPFFEGTTQVDDSPLITGLVVSFAGITPNPCSVSQNVLATVRLSSVVGVHRVLPATGWLGSGPYYMDVNVPDVTADGECFAYVDHEATVLQRAAEGNAGLLCSVLSSGIVRVQALNTKPTVDIPMVFFNGGLGSFTEVSVPASAWQGSGPWTATVSAPTFSTAFAGVTESTGATGAEEMARCAIHISAMSSGSVTLRAIGAKPTVDLTVGLLGV